MTNNDFIVSFTDILGFSNAIKSYESGERPTLFNDIKDAISDSKELFKKTSINHEPNFKTEIDIRLFSDCMATAKHIDTTNFFFADNVIFHSLFLGAYQNNLMKLGFSVRGGLTIGKYATDENLIFSGALLEAVELEKKAKHPRILVSNSILDLLKSDRKANPAILKELIAVDQDGIAFINNFNIGKVTILLFQEIANKLGLNIPISIPNNSEPTKIAIQEFFNQGKNSESESIRSKYEWLGDYFDWSMNGKQGNFEKWESR